MKDSLIQNAPLLSSLSPDEQQQIASAMTEMTFGKGETLTAQGQPTNRMYLIQSGWVKQSTQLEGGRNIVNNLGPGSLVGEMDVLLDQPAAGTSTSNSEVSVWALSQCDLQQVLDSNPRIGLKLSAALGNRIKHVDQYLVQKRLRVTRPFSDLTDEQLSA